MVSAAVADVQTCVVCPPDSVPVVQICIDAHSMPERMVAVPASVMTCVGSQIPPPNIMVRYCLIVSSYCYCAFY